MPVVLIALGSNVGDRVDTLRRAVTKLEPAVQVVRVSQLYETVPMYVEDQFPFLNGALLGQTELSPMALLAHLKAVEREVGRLERVRFGPREIDLDLIAYGVTEYVFESQGRVVLELPHPRAHERRFVLQPLADVAPDFRLPPKGTVEALLRLTEDQKSGVLQVQEALIG